MTLFNVILPGFTGKPSDSYGYVKRVMAESYEQVASVYNDAIAIDTLLLPDCCTKKIDHVLYSKSPL